MSEHEHKTITIEVNYEEYQVTQGKMTPNEILTLAGKDPATTYLVQVEGRHEESYKDRPTQEIQLHPNMKFITASRGPATVSGW